MFELASMDGYKMVRYGILLWVVCTIRNNPVLFRQDSDVIDRSNISMGLVDILKYGFFNNRALI